MTAPQPSTEQDLISKADAAERMGVPVDWKRVAVALRHAAQSECERLNAIAVKNDERAKRAQEEQVRLDADRARWRRTSGMLNLRLDFYTAKANLLQVQQEALLGLLRHEDRRDLVDLLQRHNDQRADLYASEDAELCEAAHARLLEMGHYGEIGKATDEMGFEIIASKDRPEEPESEPEGES